MRSKQTLSAPQQQSGALDHGLLVVHANRFEDAVDLALEALRRNPPAPLQALWVLTPGSGLRSWLEQRIAQVLGVCAGVRFDWPGAFLWRLARGVLGEAAVPTRFALDKPTLVWRLMRVLGALVQRPEGCCEAVPGDPGDVSPGLPPDWARDPRWQALRQHLQDDARAQRRYALAAELADVFDGYQTYRADWLQDWAAGQDRLAQGAGLAEPLPAAQGWQPLLWRCVLAQGGLAASDARDGVLAQWVTRLQSAAPDDATLGAVLPAQVLVVGFASLPAQTLQALDALARHRPVWVAVQNPSPHFWGDDADLSAQARRLWRSRRVAVAQPAGLGHPLLSAWGQVGRDGLAAWDALDAQQAALAQADQAGAPERAGLRLDCFVDPLAACAGPPTRLARWQSDVFHLRPAPAQPEALADDASITLVGCSSALREIEVLHDHLLAWFDADPTLQPQDVIVMAPDLGPLGALIDAVFGQYRPGEAAYVPYTLADGAAQPAPLVRTLTLLLQGVQAHWTLAQALELLALPGVRARLGLAHSDVTRLLAQLQSADLRWGLDGAHRCSLGLALPEVQLEPGTWAQAVRRLLLGYALGREGQWAGLSAQPGWSGLDADLAGALLSLLDNLAWAQHALAGAHGVADWVLILGELMRRFITPQDDEQADWQAALHALDDWRSVCADAGFDQALPLEVVRAHWLSPLAAARASARWLSGGVQFATLMPMRAVPFRVVALIGLNDGDYPRSPLARAFDLLDQGAPRPGDRSRRDDDRYLLLQALLAARERLYLSWCSRSARDGSVREPSVLVAQLRQDWAARWQNPPRLIEQPVQPFSRAYTQPATDCFTYAQQWQAFWAATPVEQAQVAPENIANNTPEPPDQAMPAQPPSAPAGAASPPAVHTTQSPPAPQVSDLLALLRQPSSVFTRLRLRLPAPQDVQPLPDAEVFALDALADWQLRLDLLHSPDVTQVATRWRDALPLGERATYEQEIALQRISSLRGQLQKLKQNWHAETAVQDFIVPLAQAADGALRLRLDTLWRTPQGDLVQLSARPGRLWADSALQAPRVRVGAQPWLTHLIANAAGCPLHTQVWAEDGHWALSPGSQEAALEALERLLAAWADAWECLPPLPAESGWSAWLAQANALRSAQSDDQAQAAAEKALGKTWLDQPRRGQPPLPGECRQLPLLARAYPQVQDLWAAGLLDWAERVYGDWGRACLALVPQTHL